jgi:hypothetical protein
MYCDTHASVDTITWNGFKAHFCTHYVPRGTLKLKKKEFANLRQDSMLVNEYLNLFIQLARYAPNNVNMDEKKHDMFLNGLNDDIQFQLLNTDYIDFQHMVHKAMVIENKIKEMEKDGKRKVTFHGHPSRSNVRPCFSQPNQFFKPPQMNRPQMQCKCRATKHSSTAPELPVKEASTSSTLTYCAATVSLEHAASPLP